MKIDNMIHDIQGLRVARVSTIPFSMVTQLRPQLEAIYQAGALLTIISSQDALSDGLSELPYCDFKPIHIARKINLFSDLVTLFKLWRMFRIEQFDVVHSITPKAGLLCALAGRAAGTSIRLHTYTGQTWVTMRGIKKAIVKYSDKLISYLNTLCYTDSDSQRDFLIHNKIVDGSNIRVLGSGSLAGVDLQRFSSTCFTSAETQLLRQSLNIDDDTRVLLFVGRITEDKGIHELLNAFAQVLQSQSNLVLLIVGPFENKLEPMVRSYAQQQCGEKVVFTGFSSQPERFMAIADVLCIPSYREGFGTVVIEAAAMGVPAVGTRIYGLTDAIIEGKTGLLVQPKNVDELACALKKLIQDETLRKQLGENAKKRAINEFDSKIVGELLIREYRNLLK